MITFHHEESPAKHQYFFFVAVVFLLVLATTGCSQQPIRPEKIQVTIFVDGNEKTIEASPGISVQDALVEANIILGTLDRVDPPVYTILADSLSIKVIRVREEFSIVESIIDYEKLNVRNESLPEGQILLIQPGINGQQQITYRKVYEDEIPGQKTIFKTEVISQPQPEIIMVGVQTPFTAVPISGKLAYLTAGNAWVMMDSTANRKPLLTTGDLDGRIFSLSEDGKWLLFTRKSDEDNTINELWAADISQEELKPIDLRVKNVIHFAAWRPNNTLTLAYSTVEPRTTSPGWQANNDLYLLKINENGIIINQEEIVEANSGGIYGWWGINYVWSPDGKQLAFIRPDSIGLVDFENKELEPLLDLIPVQTKSDWAWVPGLSWSFDHKLIYTVLHQPMDGTENNEASPIFNLAALSLPKQIPIDIVQQSGMFAYPAASPIQTDGSFYIAYLQSIFPDRSDDSRYRLAVMDRDGSNQRDLFPAEGSAGLDPQRITWSPPQNGDIPLRMAIMYQGNLWLVNPINGQYQQITGDGSINRIDWK